MTKQNIEQKPKEIIKPYIGNEEAFKNLTSETHLLADLKINSAHLVDVILDSEDIFDIEIDDESAEKMITVQAALDIISDKLKDK